MRPVAHRFLIRGHRPGDIERVVARHASLYESEHGWGAAFAGLVADVAHAFERDFRPGRERAFIAERDGAFAGCVFCVQRDATTAQLRMLLVEPWARGTGLGGRLVRECVRFARDAGYGTLVLWTNSTLDPARRLYEREGFTFVSEQPEQVFGAGSYGQYWSLDLRGSTPAEAPPTTSDTRE